MYVIRDFRLFKYWLRRELVIAAGCMGIFCFPASAQPASCEADAPPSLLSQEVVLQRVALCNREVVNAKRTVIASQADRQVAGQAPNPTLTAGVGSVNPKLGIGAGSYTDKTFDTSLRYEQLIERGGKRDLRSRSAEQLIMASKQDVLDVQRQQGAATLQAMVDLAAADEKVSLLSEIAALYEETLRANTRRSERGDLAPIDAQRQEIDATRAQIDLRQAQADAARNRLTLAGLLAWEPHANLLHADPAILDSAPITMDRFDPTERADIKAARLRLEAALVQRDLAQALSKADVTAGLQLDHWPTSTDNPTGTGNTFSVSISFPFLVRHSFGGELARAISDSEAAREMLQRIEAGAKADWARMNADVASAQARLQLLRTEQIPRAEQVARAAELGYSKGALSVLELLDARRVLRQARLDVLAARADLARATLARNRWITSSPD